MGLTEDFETSLQVLRGFDADITVEVNEIKVNCSEQINHLTFTIVLVLKKKQSVFSRVFSCP